MLEDTQRTGLASRTRELPDPHPSPGASALLMEEPLLAASGDQQIHPGSGEQGSPWSLPLGPGSGPRVGQPLGQMQSLLQWQMAATRGHRRVRHGQLWPRVPLARRTMCVMCCSSGSVLKVTVTYGMARRHLHCRENAW